MGGAPPPLPPSESAGAPDVPDRASSRARELGALLEKYLRLHLPALPHKDRRPPAPPRETGAYAKALPLLRLVPLVLAGLFALSFWWDFDGLTLTLFGYGLALDGLLRITTVSGLIGFLTNWLAITMLFQPREPRPLFGQGVIPSQRERVVYRLAKAVSEELINEEIIKQKIEQSRLIPRYREMTLTVMRNVLEDPAFRHELKGVAAGYAREVLSSHEVRQKIVAFTVEKMEQYAGEGLSGIALKAYRYFNEDDLQERIDRALRELPISLDDALDELDPLLDALPEQIEAHSDDLEVLATRAVLAFVENLDVYTMIMENMHAYDEQRLENLLKRTTNEQLTYIKYLGGVLGALGGFVIWKPLLALGVFGAVGLVLYALDEALYRSRPSA